MQAPMQRAQVILGRCLRQLREEKKISQEKLAAKSDITYQYLSALENGKENFSIGVLEALAAGLNLSVAKLVAIAYGEKAAPDFPKVNPAYFRKVPLPGKLDLKMLEDALNETQRIIFQINGNLRAIGAKSLPQYIQSNNFSGLISNLLCDSLSDFSCFKHNSHQKYPDLICPSKGSAKEEGLEVKATTQVGKGGESHNGHSGWHLIACYKITPETGNILFIHVMLANLNSHTHEFPDGNYVVSKVNEATGSRRTETYNTNVFGTAKLRDGSVYLDTDEIKHARWKHKRRDGIAIPAFSMFIKKVEQE